MLFLVSLVFRMVVVVVVSVGSVWVPRLDHGRVKKSLDEALEDAEAWLGDGEGAHEARASARWWVHFGMMPGWRGKGMVVVEPWSRGAVED